MSYQLAKTAFHDDSEGISRVEMVVIPQIYKSRKTCEYSINYPSRSKSSFYLMNLPAIQRAGCIEMYVSVTNIRLMFYANDWKWPYFVIVHLSVFCLE